MQRQGHILHSTDGSTVLPESPEIRQGECISSAHTRPEKLAERGSPFAAADAAAALDWARFAQAGRLRTLKEPGRALKLESDAATEPAMADEEGTLMVRLRLSR